MKRKFVWGSIDRTVDLGERDTGKPSRTDRCILIYHNPEGPSTPP